MSSAPGFLGQGWAYPLVPVPAGNLDYAAGADKVAQSIWIILDTDPGERIMRPTFGCGLRRYLMKPNTSAIRALIKHDVQIALANLELQVNQAGDTTRADSPSAVANLDYENEVTHA